MTGDEILEYAKKKDEEYSEYESDVGKYFDNLENNAIKADPPREYIVAIVSAYEGMLNRYMKHKTNAEKKQDKSRKFTVKEGSLSPRDISEEMMVQTRKRIREKGIHIKLKQGIQPVVLAENKEISETEKNKDEKVDLSSKTKIDQAKTETEPETEKNLTDKQIEERYKERLEKLHSAKMIAYKDQLRKDKLNPDEKEFAQIIALEKEMVKLKQQYKGDKSELDEHPKNDEYKKKELIKEQEIRERFEGNIGRADEMNKRLKDANAKIEGLNYFLRTNQITKDQYLRETEVAEAQRAEAMWKLTIINPIELHKQENVFEIWQEEEKEQLGVNYDRNQMKEMTKTNRDRQKDILDSEKEDRNIAQMQAYTTKQLDNELAKSDDKTLDDIRRDDDKPKTCDEAIENLSNDAQIATTMQSRNEIAQNTEQNMKTNSIDYSDVKEPIVEKNDIAKDLENAEQLVKQEVSRGNSSAYNEFRESLRSMTYSEDEVIKNTAQRELKQEMERSIDTPEKEGKEKSI